jgi:lipopolysaccharide transport system ATP-binding protein
MTITRTSKVIKDRPVIELQNVSRSFELQREKHRSFQESFIRLFRHRNEASEQFWPLRNVSLAIYPGDCVGIIGVNGSGKSTLLKLVSGILPPTSGDLSVHGRISSLLELGAGFHPELTGRENIYLNGSIYGMTRKEMDRRLDDIVDYAELGNFIDTPIKHYSSGMYVRLGFSVAIHTNPDIMLVDEVLAVGDLSFQRKCLRSISEFRKRGGTLMLVSHDLGTMQTICDRLLWIEDGVVRAEGNATDVAMEYQSFTMHRDEERQQPAIDGENSENHVRRWGTGHLRITKVEFLNSTDTPGKTFMTGDSMTVRLHYETDEIIEEPVFGLAIHDQSGTHLSGPNTRFDQLSIPSIQGVGILDYTVPSLPLLEGGYSLSVAVVNQTDTDTYDYHDRLYDFYVYRGACTERYGMITLKGSWKLQSPGIAPNGTSEHNVHINAHINECG